MPGSTSSVVVAAASVVGMVPMVVVVVGRGHLLLWPESHTGGGSESFGKEPVSVWRMDPTFSVQIGNAAATGYATSTSRCGRAVARSAGGGVLIERINVVN